MDELCFRVVAEVKVAEERVLAQLMGDLVAIFFQGLLVQVIADAHSATDDEVHLKDFLLFVINHVFVFFFAEMTGLQAESNVVKELAIFVFLGVEEESKVVEDIIEEVVNNDSAFDASRQRIDELIVFLNLAEAVVGPVVLKVLVDLAIQAVGQGFVFPEARQQGHPVVKLKCLLLYAQILVEGGNDFDETSHNEGEETDAAQHDQDSENLLRV
jgi:hypothetical protein